MINSWQKILELRVFLWIKNYPPLLDFYFLGFLAVQLFVRIISAARMRDLVFVTAYCPTEEQERSLDRCIDSVIACGFHVALISHSHVSLHIQKKCNYYFFDYLNDISDNPGLLGLKYYNFPDKVIQSIFFDKYFYGFSIYRMFSMASQIAINFGYSFIHHIEYDCQLLDKELLKEHTSLLENYDSVIYTNSGTGEGFLYGPLKSFKVSSLPTNFKNYNRKFISEEIQKIQPAQLEFLTRRIFLDAGKVLFKNRSELANRFIGSQSFYNRNLHYTLFYNEQNGSLNIFYKGFEFSERITIITNNRNVFNLDVQANHWHMLELGAFEDIENVRIDNSSKILLNVFFDPEKRELYKHKSFICEKDN